MAVSIVGADSSCALVYPHGLSLGAAAAALETAGIAHYAGRFPLMPDEAGETIVLYLVEEARLLGLGSRTTVESALALIARVQRATTIVLAERGTRCDWLAANPHVGGWLVAPIEPAALVATARAAAATIAAREDVREARGESEHLLRIGLALSAERDIAKLHRTIVRSARELTKADSGSLFLLEDDAPGERVLRFAVAQTGPRDAGTYLGSVLPLSETSISGYVALSGEVVRIADAYALGTSAPYRFNPSFDRTNGYRTKSVLCVPMRDHDGAIVGVLQLINRKPEFELQLDSPAHTERVVEPFSERDEAVLLSLASQAAVALENRALLDSIHELFEQFVRASVKAIEVRDKATQGHSERVADLTVLQAEAINAVESGPFARLRFDADEIREMRYAALLHDFGKVAVPESIFNKAKKLPDGKLEEIRLRFLLAAAQQRERSSRLRELFAAVEAANEPRLVASRDVAAALAEIAGMSYDDVDGSRPLLTPQESAFLSIARGSLSEDERRTMERHVTQSYTFLREIPWRKTPWGNVPQFAYEHHEHLDGTGYPRGLKGDEIPVQVRLLTIGDIFDALTAHDRPYKALMSVERALDVLVHEFAERGKIDARLLDLFITKKVYEPVIARRTG